MLQKGKRAQLKRIIHLAKSFEKVPLPTFFVPREGEWRRQVWALIIRVLRSKKICENQQREEEGRRFMTSHLKNEEQVKDLFDSEF